MHLETAQAVHPLRELPMKLLVTGFKPAPDSDDQTYFFKATINGEELFFELTNAEIGEIVDDRHNHQLPHPFDFGMREPMIVLMFRTLHTVYWKDEDGVLDGCSIDLSSPNSPW